MPPCPRLVGDIYQPSYTTVYDNGNLAKTHQNRTDAVAGSGDGAGRAGRFRCRCLCSRAKCSKAIGTTRGGEPRAVVCSDIDTVLSRSLLDLILTIIVEEALAGLVWCYCTVCCMQ